MCDAWEQARDRALSHVNPELKVAAAEDGEDSEQVSRRVIIEGTFCSDPSRRINRSTTGPPAGDVARDRAASRCGRERRRDRPR
jgi:hypothetical protein